MSPLEMVYQYFESLASLTENLAFERFWVLQDIEQYAKKLQAQYVFNLGMHVCL